MVAEEEREDIFFAPLNLTVNSSIMINAPDLTSASNNNNNHTDEDAWGDFVSSAPSRVEPGSNPWGKLQEALPLSIFGEEEEEEGSGASDSSAIFLYNKSFESAKKGLDLVNVDALIANLYKQTDPENGKVETLKENELVLNWQWADVNPKQQELSLDWNALDLKPNELNSNGNFSNSVVKEGSSSVQRGNGGLGNGNNDGDDGGDDDDDDDDGWEFKGARPKTFDGYEISPTNQTKAETATISNFNGFNSSWNALSVDVNGWSSNVGGLYKNENWLNVGVVDDSEKSHDDDGWEFKETTSRSQTGDDNSKDGQSRAKNVSNWNLNGSNSSWDVLHSDSSALSSNFGAVHTNGEQMNTILVDKSKDFGAADEWDFKGAESESHSGNENTKFDQVDQVKSENGPTWKFDESDSGRNVLSLDKYKMKPISNGVNSDARQATANLFDENEDSEDEDGWEFKAAESESGVRCGKTKENTEGPMYTFGFDNSTGGSGGMLAASERTFKNSSELDFGFDLNSSLTNDIDSSNGFGKSENNDTQNSWHVSPINVDSHENSWAFKDAYTETGLMDEEFAKVAEVSSSVENFASVGESQDKERSDNHKGALPLSIFGEEKEANDPVIYEDIATQRPTSNTRDDMRSPHLDVSINDIISSLYSQAQLHTSVNQISSEKGSTSPKTVMTLNLASDDDNYDDDSWEFKDASSGEKAEYQTSILNLEESRAELSTKTEQNDYLDLFSKLKEQLNFVLMHHLENLKKARSAAALSNKDAETEALDKKIQDLHNGMPLEDMTSSELESENHLPRSMQLNEFIKVLQQPKFQLFESEYQLSNKLSLVENDSESAIRLLRNVATTVKILSLVSGEEQSRFISTWSKLLSVCSQELKHGAMIWKQSLQKQVQYQILSKPQGQKYMLALGEMYRVVEVIGSSARLYKPWILASSTDASGIYTLLSECSMLWSSSGLEEALRSISDPCNFEYDGSIKTLLDSIKHVRELDAYALYDRVFSGQDPMCQLSGLTTGTVPGMKTVIWNGEYYFLTLANLWANLISCDPPSLACIRIGDARISWKRS